MTAQDSIWGSSDVTSGDWLRVKVDGHDGESWMMTTMGGTSLLVPDGQGAPSMPPPVVEPTQPIEVRPVTAPPSPRQNNYMAQSAQAPPDNYMAQQTASMLSQSAVDMNTVRHHTQLSPGAHSLDSSLRF